MEKRETTGEPSPPSGRAAATLKRGDAPPDALSEAARQMGRTRSERKAATSRENAARRMPEQMPGRTPKPLAEIPCRCDAGGAMVGHRWDCPRGQAIKRREKAGAL